jgi:hypothetical protein
MIVVIDDIEYVQKRFDYNPTPLTKALDTKIFCDRDNSIMSIREYLYELFSDLFHQGEDFNSKRPWGNSGWQFDVYTALIREGILPGMLDSEGFLNNCDEDECKKFVIEMIKFVFFDKTVV